MASGSILTSGPSPEEQKEADKLAQEEWDKTHSRKQIQGGINNTYRIPGGGDVVTYTLKNGTQGFQMDGTTYYLNEDNGRWESNTRRHDYYNLGSVSEPAAAAAPNSTGLLVGEVVDPVSGAGMTEDKGMTTEDIMGDTYDTMVDWRPTTPGQVVNPLVNAGNWLTELDPGDQEYYDPGTYVNPQIQQLQGMLQTPQVSKNPYSLLG